MFRSLLVLCVAGMLAGPVVAQTQRDSVPPLEYYAALRVYQEGDYASALQGFRSAARGGVRSTEGLWVDSICYHAMMGECFYHLGDAANALDQAHAAIKLAAFHSDWLLRIEFPPTVEPSPVHRGEHDHLGREDAHLPHGAHPGQDPESSGPEG